ncbi:MAG: AAA family ATPase [Nitrospinales bacterium]
MLQDYTEEIDQEKAQEEVDVLKEKVRKMGDVNLEALSEYQKTSERFNFLNQQQEDLAQSIQTLHSAIDKVNRTIKERFQVTFQQVNENFQSIFARVFQGGKAHLTLTDESDPLESGIEISAQPPGKKMQNISLLSAGEKALTAVSLIFAIFKVRPSPFCLLDEVDAPLDESNLLRFQNLLREMSTNTQFILITHNQKTMAFADILYGVTMEERGVSKVVSVNLN